MSDNFIQFSLEALMFGETSVLLKPAKIKSAVLPR